MVSFRTLVGYPCVLSYPLKTPIQDLAIAVVIICQAAFMPQKPHFGWAKALLMAP